VRRGVRQLVDRARGEPTRPLVEEIMLAFGRLGVAIAHQPALREAPEVRALIDELQPVLHDQSIVFDAYPGDVLLHFTGTWDGGELAQLGWLRSCMQFFADLIGGTPGAGELTSWQESIDDLDDHLRQWAEREGGFAAAELGVPRSHWWWRFAA
jgi:hypothetical protein